MGKNEKGECEAIPRSDIKALSIASDGSALYLQACWKTYYNNLLDILTEKEHKDLPSAKTSTVPGGSPMCPAGVVLSDGGVGRKDRWMFRF